MPAITPAWGQNARIFDLPLNDSERLRLLFSTPVVRRGIIVMLPGGTGDIGLEQNGRIRHGDNFMVRTRGQWTLPVIWASPDFRGKSAT